MKLGSNDEGNTENAYYTFTVDTKQCIECVLPPCSAAPGGQFSCALFWPKGQTKVYLPMAIYSYIALISSLRCAVVRRRGEEVKCREDHKIR